MEKEQVKEALRVLDEAVVDDDFKKWIEDHYGELNERYDAYVEGCMFRGYKPEGFFLWALREFLEKR